MRVHGALNGIGDLRKADFPVHERFDRDFVRRVQNCRQRPAHFPGPARQRQGRKPFQIRLFKGQLTQLRKFVCTRSLAARSG